MAKKTNRRINLYSLKKELLEKIEMLEKRVTELEGVDRPQKEMAHQEKQIPDGVWDPSKTTRPENIGNKKIVPTQMQSNEKVKTHRLDKKERK